MANFGLLTTYTKTLHDQTFCVTDTISTWSLEEMEEEEGEEWGGASVVAGLLAGWLLSWSIIPTRRTNGTLVVIRLRATWVQEKEGGEGEWCARERRETSLEHCKIHGIPWHLYTLWLIQPKLVLKMCDFIVCNVCVCFAPINCENAPNYWQKLGPSSDPICQSKERF